MPCRPHLVAKNMPSFYEISPISAPARKAKCHAWAIVGQRRRRRAIPRHHLGAPAGQLGEGVQYVSAKIEAAAEHRDINAPERLAPGDDWGSANGLERMSTEEASKAPR